MVFIYVWKLEETTLAIHSDHSCKVLFLAFLFYFNFGVLSFSESHVSTLKRLDFYSSNHTAQTISSPWEPCIGCLSLYQAFRHASCLIFLPASIHIFSCWGLSHVQKSTDKQGGQMSVWILWNLSFKRLWAAWYGCLLLNLGPLKEQNVILGLSHLSDFSYQTHSLKFSYLFFVFSWFLLFFFGAMSFYVLSTVLELVCKPASLEFIEIFLVHAGIKGVAHQTHF